MGRSRLFSTATTRGIPASLVLLGMLALPAAVRAERIGTSCEDCPNYSGAYSIENATGVAINYQYRWGKEHPWKNMRLETGHIETHSYPLGEDPHARVPTPYVRFDAVGGDAGVTTKEYRMEFFAVGYAGYGPRVNRTEPKRYYFRYAQDGHGIDIKAK